jgi:hypothetical protein
MPYNAEFEAGVQAFMNRYTIYLPGALGDGGMIDFNDPSYAATRNVNTPIDVPAAVVKAAWMIGPRPSHVKLVLRLSRDYKMLPTGRREPALAIGDGGAADRPIEGTYEAAKQNVIVDARAGGATTATAKAFAKEVLRRTGQRVEGDEWLDCYFLPWSRGRSTRMALGNAAPFFFTAAMNGCSFLVSGPAAAPTVSHLNTTQPGDDLPDADVSKATIKARYAGAVGVGSPASALLTKYKPPPAFQGNVQRYKEQPGEVANINDPDIAPVDPMHPHHADINTFLIGVRDPAAGWQFFYQRTAILPTFVDKPRFQPFAYEPDGMFATAKMKVGMEHAWTVTGGARATVRDKVTINHRVTPCQRLNFP